MATGETLYGSLQGLRFTPIENPYGLGASTLAQSLPTLINPYGSVGANLGIALGGTLIAALLGYQARQQASDMSIQAMEYGNQLMTLKTPEERLALVKGIDDLQVAGRVADLSNYLTAQQTSIDQERQKLKYLSDVETLQNVKQQFAITDDAAAQKLSEARMQAMGLKGGESATSGTGLTATAQSADPQLAAPVETGATQAAPKSSSTPVAGMTEDQYIAKVLGPQPKVPVMDPQRMMMMTASEKSAEMQKIDDAAKARDQWRLQSEDIRKRFQTFRDNIKEAKAAVERNQIAKDYGIAVEKFPAIQKLANSNDQTSVAAGRVLLETLKNPGNQVTIQEFTQGGTFQSDLDKVRGAIERSLTGGPDLSPQERQDLIRVASTIRDAYGAAYNKLLDQQFSSLDKIGVLDLPKLTGNTLKAGDIGPLPKHISTQERVAGVKALQERIAQNVAAIQRLQGQPGSESMIGQLTQDINKMRARAQELTQ